MYKSNSVKTQILPVENESQPSDVAKFGRHIEKAYGEQFLFSIIDIPSNVLPTVHFFYYIMFIYVAGPIFRFHVAGALYRVTSECGWENSHIILKISDPGLPIHLRKEKKRENDVQTSPQTEFVT